MRTVLVTGTSTGIGEATARALATRGWRVFATMRNLDAADALKQRLGEQGAAAHVEFERLDVTDPESIRTAVEAVLLRTGNRLDAVVHNAGVAAGGAFEDLPTAEIRRVMETNFFGVLELTRHLLPVFRAQRHGRIVLVSSEAAFSGQPANSIYCASKWALEGWAESLRYELAPMGLDVIVVEPGPTLTPIWQSSPRLIPADSPYRGWTQSVSDAVDRHVARTGRDPGQAADAIADVLEVRRPRFRYPVGLIARFTHLLRGKVPTRLVQRATAWYMGLGAPARNA